MEHEHKVKFLRTVPLFHETTDEHLTNLAHAIESRVFDEGQVVVGPDSASGDLLIALQGEYRVLLRQREVDAEVELTRLYPGDYFGDLALVAGERPRVTIVATKPGVVLCLKGCRFEEQFASSPDFARKVCRSLAGYVAQTFDRLGVVPYVQLDRFPKLSETIGLLPARVCRACRCLIISRDGLQLKVAMVDPLNAEIRQFVAQALRSFELHWVAISEHDFETYAARYLAFDVDRGADRVPFERLDCVGPGGETYELNGPGGNELLAGVLSRAVRRGASDVHLEPGRDAACIRFRIDGRMIPLEQNLPSNEFRQMVSQIKVMADLDITRNHLPQDGSFTVHADDKQLEIRVSTIPCVGGEKAVLRLIAPNPEFQRLENLMVEPALARLAKDIFHSPSGLILVTGPTGSGKTTTLYAGVNSLWHRDQAINVVTIEDPVEYNLPFATQTQVHRETDLDFATFLRATMRQDPDVILVGEIRDAESAAIAVEAATTGHLVLSSLHTHSAFETIARLRQLQIKPYLLADALRGVISQKLVPRLRPGMTEPIDPSEPIYDRLMGLGVLPVDFDGILHGPCAQADDDPHSAAPPDPPEVGRVGVFEVLAITDAMRDLIDREAPINELKARIDPDLFVSFASSSRYLLEHRLVAPERIERIFSRIDARRLPTHPPQKVALA